MLRDLHLDAGQMPGRRCLPKGAVLLQVRVQRRQLLRCPDRLPDPAELQQLHRLRLTAGRVPAPNFSPVLLS
jgi:hypothetical protein